MTDDQIHKEVIKVMGWKLTNAGCWVPPPGRLFQAVKSPPPLTLELMWQAEEMLSAEEADEYGLQLNDIMFHDCEDGIAKGRVIDECDWHATAIQRARAFLKVKSTTSP